MPDAPSDAACPTIGPQLQVSRDTPAATRWVTAAGNGTETMTMWSLGSRTVWAEYDAGGVVGSGDVDGWPNTGSLIAVGSHFVANNYNELRVFDGASWNAYPFVNTFSAVSGSSLLGVNGGEATIFDGTTVSPPTTITTHGTLAAGGDGQGGFGVLTVDGDNSLGVVVHLSLATFDGTAWAPETLIAAVNDGSSYFVDPAVVHLGTGWAVMFAVDDVLTIEVGSGTSWTRKTFSSTGSDHFDIAANGGVLAILGNGGFAAVYKNGIWTSRVLTSTPGGGLLPRVMPLQSGFVAVYGDASGTHAAIYDGTAWGSDVVLTTQSATYGFSLAVSPGAAAVGFVDGPPSQLQKEVRIFQAGAWGAPFAAPSGGLAHWEPPGLGVESDGIRAVYSAPGTAETSLEASGTWSMPETMPAAPTSGEVFGGTVAQADNGHALAVWRQVVADQYGVFASEFDGDQWRTPVLIDASSQGSAPYVQAAGSVFVISWTTTDLDGFPEGMAGRWTGTGTAPIVSNGVMPRVLWDGSMYVAVWVDGFYPQQHVYWATSPDAIVWTSGGSLVTGDPYFWWMGAGPAGAAMVVEERGTHALTVAFWHGGVLSLAPAQPNMYGNCSGAVGTTDAVIVCDNLSSSPIDALVHSGNSWSHVVTPTSVHQFLPAVSTDGTDFRFDYGLTTQSQSWSTVLHNGAWSSVVTDPPGGVVISSVSACGAWSSITWQYAIWSAQGSAPFAFDHATQLPPNTLSITTAHDHFNASWFVPTATSRGQARFFVQLGL